MIQKKKNISGPRIRLRRLEQSITQKNLAAHMTKRGVSMTASMISAIENQNRQVWCYELVAFSKCLKICVNSLLGWKEK